MTLIGKEIGKDYGITDADGNSPPSVRETTCTSPPQFARHKVK